MDRAEYAKRDGTSGISGQLYELKLIMHFLLSGLIAKKDGKIDHFYLGTNVDTAGSFDDLVFKYIHGTVSKIVLLQAKHKDKPTNITLNKLLSKDAKRGDFSIKHYFDSYQDIKKEFCNTVDTVLKDEFENCEFILISNATFEKKSTPVIYKVDVDDFWKMVDGGRTKFSADETVSKRIYDIFVGPKTSVNEVKQFIKQFTILLDQPNESELEELVKEQIGSYLGVVKEDVKNIYEMTYKKIQNYWKYEKYYLTEVDDLFLSASNVWKMKKESSSKIDYYCSLGVNYKQVESLQITIKNNAFIHVRTDESNYLLHDLQVHQILNNLKVEYIFLDYFKFKEMHETAIKSLKEEYDVLVITDSNLVNMNEYDHQLGEILKMCPEKKVILIAKVLETNLDFKNIEDVNVKFSYLEDADQNKIMQETEIQIQGKVKILENVILPRFIHAIDDRFLVDLIKRKPLVIGKMMRDLGEVKSQYVFRMLKYGNNYVAPKDLLKIGSDGKFILIAGEPGIGKSTLLSSLAEECLRSDQLWHYRIDLIDHSSAFADGKIKDALNFLREACKMGELEFKLFSEYYKSEGKITLFFDGFDEIGPEYEDVVIDLFNKLSRSKVDKIWVTTRTIIKDQLEKTLMTTSYQLEIFSIDEQKTFCKLISEKSDEEINQILKKLSQSVNDLVGQFYGIPLQLKMLMEIYDKLNFDQEINIFRIYDRYIYKKYFDVQWKEKAKVDIKIIFVKHQIEMGCNDAKIKYGKLALFAMYRHNIHHLFSSEEIEEITGKLIDEVIEGSEFSGIIKAVVNRKPIFVHNTYAEFFIATYLVHALKNKKNIKDFLNAINFFDVNQNVIRNFFDYALSDNVDICRAALNSQIERIKELKDDIKICDQGGRNALHLAAANSSSEVIEALLEAGAEVTTVDSILNWTPISYADKLRRWPAIELLLNAKADSACMFETIMSMKNCSDGDQTVAHTAAEKGYVELLKAVLKMKPDCVNFKAVKCLLETPLHMALKNDKLEALRCVLDMKEYQNDDDSQSWKINLNSEDYFGSTILNYALSRGHYDIAKLLVDRGSTLSSDLFFYMSSQARIAGNTAVLEFLLHNENKIIRTSHNLRINSGEPKEDCTISDAVLLNDINNAIEEKDSNKIGQILQKSPNLVNRIMTEHDYSINFNLLSIRQINKTLVNRIFYSICIDFPDVLKQLVSNNQRFFTYSNSQQVTILHFMCGFGDLSTIISLLEIGADPMIKDKRGRTCPHWAAAKGRIEVFKHFMTLNRNWINIRDRDGKNVLHTAAEFDRTDFANYLLEIGADPFSRDGNEDTFLHQSIEEDHLEFTKHFLSSNIDWLNLLGKNRETLIHRACRFNRVDITKYLITLGADPLMKDRWGYNSFHLAFKEEHTEVIKHLLKYNKNWINAKGFDGSTLLNWAARKRTRKEMVLWLLDFGADPTAVDDCGRTCLHSAALGGDLDVVGRLSTLAPDSIHAKDSEGLTPIELARRCARMEVVDYLSKFS